MDIRIVVCTCLLLVGTATSVPGPLSGPPPPVPDGSPLGPPYPLGNKHQGTNDSQGLQAAPGQLGSFPSSLNDNLVTSGHLNQQQSAYGFSIEGQILAAPTQPNNLQDQGLYQASMNPYDRQQILHPFANLAPSTQNYVQRFPVLLQQQPTYQTHLPYQYQLSQQPYTSGLPPQTQSGPFWRQLQQDGQYGLPNTGYLGSFPYIPPAPSYLPSTYNHVPLVLEAPHDFTPFPAGYGRLPMGVGSYGTKVFGGPIYPQGYAASAVPPQQEIGYTNRMPYVEAGQTYQQGSSQGQIPLISKAQVFQAPPQVYGGKIINEYGVEPSEEQMPPTSNDLGSSQTTGKQTYPQGYAARPSQGVMTLTSNQGTTPVSTFPHTFAMRPSQGQLSFNAKETPQTYSEQNNPQGFFKGPSQGLIPLTSNTQVTPQSYGRQVHPQMYAIGPF